MKKPTLRRYDHLSLTALFKLIYICLSLATVVSFPKIYAQTGAAVGKIANIIGQAEILRDNKTIPVAKDTPVFESDTLVTHEKTAVKMLFTDGSSVVAFQNTKTKIIEYKYTKKEGGNTLKSTVDVAVGKMRAFVKNQDNTKVDAKFETPNAVMGIRGTTLVGEVANGKSSFDMIEGSAEITNKLTGKQVLATPGKSTDIAGSVIKSYATPVERQNQNKKDDQLVSRTNVKDGKKDDKKDEDKKDEKKDEKKEDKKEDKKSEDKQEQKSQGDQGKSTKSDDSSAVVTYGTDPNAGKTVSSNDAGLNSLISTNSTQPKLNSISPAAAKVTEQITQTVQNQTQQAVNQVLSPLVNGTPTTTGTIVPVVPPTKRPVKIIVVPPKIPK